MTETDAARIISLLQEIRDDQRLQLERQAEALALQREQFALVQKSQERAETYTWCGLFCVTGTLHKDNAHAVHRSGIA